MKVTLSSDHRAIDGATAARFLQEVKRLLEDPFGLMHIDKDLGEASTVKVY